MFDRRTMLKTAGAGVMLAGAAARAGSALAQAAPATPIPNTHGLRGIGAAPTGWGLRRRANTALKIDWIDYCHQIGMATCEESGAPPTDAAAQAEVRSRIEKYNMRLTYEYRPPKTAAEVPAFEAVVKAAKNAGAYALHAGLTQRRYEELDSFAQFQTNFKAMQDSVALSVPILEKYKMPASIENHKGWRAVEHAAWFKRVSSEYIRVHFDFGNNVSLCEDPMETLDILLPYIFGCHIKDMGVSLYEDGFLLSEVPLGTGFLDLKAMVAKLRAKDANMAFDLEMITRDPLKIPVFTDKYYASFDQTISPMPARDVAHMLQIAAKNTPAKPPLPKLTGLSPADQLALEDKNNADSIAWAHANLDM